MAFDITPTSGAAPYTFSLTVNNKESIDGINFSAEFRGVTQTSSCPIDGLAGNNSNVIVDELLSTGSYIAPSSIPEGSCRAYTFLIKRLFDDVVIASSSVFVDNVV